MSGSESDPAVRHLAEQLEAKQRELDALRRDLVRVHWAMGTRSLIARKPASVAAARSTRRVPDPELASAGAGAQERGGGEDDPEASRAHGSGSDGAAFLP